MKRLTLSEIKQTELNMMIEFDKLCRKNGLYYVMCGGTLLGAVRHKGFIPWDDDIDVLMPRKDYDRLLNMVDIDMSDFPEYLSMASWKDGSLRFPFIKILDNRTRVDAVYIADGKDSQLWIDIFPIDGNPTDDGELKRLFKRSLRARKLLTTKGARSGEGTTFTKKLFKPFVKIALLPFSFYKLCELIDNISKTYDFETSEKIGGVLWGYGPQERIDKEPFMKPVEMEFEGELFLAPSNYHQYLTGLYKDYMKLPPESEQHTHDMVVYMEE